MLVRETATCVRACMHVWVRVCLIGGGSAGVFLYACVLDVISVRLFVCGYLWGADLRGWYFLSYLAVKDILRRSFLILHVPDQRHSIRLMRCLLVVVIGGNQQLRILHTQKKSLITCSAHTLIPSGPFPLPSCCGVCVCICVWMPARMCHCFNKIYYRETFPHRQWR